MLSGGMNIPSNQSREWRDGLKSIKRKKGSGELQGEARKANIIFQESYCWWRHWRSVVLPVCIHCTSASSGPLCLQRWWRHWMIEQCCCCLFPRCCCRCCVLPATAAVSAQINAWSVTVLCCNALDSSSLMHSLPLCALLPSSLTLVHLRSVTREKTQ